MTHYVISYSGGKASFAAAARAVEYAGASSVTLIFGDTLIEDEDLYRFLREGADALGARLVWLQDGRTPWDVFRDRRFIGNSRIAPFSHQLKTKQVRAWMEANCDPADTVLCLGIDSDEYERIERAQRNWGKWTVDAPLCWRPWWGSEDVDKTLERYGLRQPRLYDHGFLHNNCGGFCVRGGKGQHAALLEQMPERYRYHEQHEQELLVEIPTTRPFLREVVDGEQRYITMRDLRERTEAEPQQADLFSMGGGCGCFVDDEEAS